MKMMIELFNRASEAFYKKAVSVGRKAKVYAPAVLLLSTAPMAHAAKISDLTQSMGTEIAAVVKLFLLALAGIGVVTAGISVISWIMAVKRSEPVKWQMWGTIGGAAAVVIPTLVLAFAGSLTDGSNGADSVFNELQIQN